MTALPDPTSPRRDDVEAVAEALMALTHSFQRARARLKDDVEWSSLVLLYHLEADGPTRAATLAESMQFDPSTVSRQVATLLKQGLLERRADPLDGRAALLTLTPRARAVLAEHDRRRLGHFEAVLEEWDDAELGQFAGMFRRFVTAFDAATATWLTERSAQPSPMFTTQTQRTSA